MQLIGEGKETGQSVVSKEATAQDIPPNQGMKSQDKQITAVTTIMKISDDRDGFERNFAKAFPKVGDQGYLPLTIEPEKKK